MGTVDKNRVELVWDGQFGAKYIDVFEGVRMYENIAYLHLIHTHSWLALGKVLKGSK